MILVDLKTKINQYNIEEELAKKLTKIFKIEVADEYVRKFKDKYNSLKGDTRRAEFLVSYDEAKNKVQWLKDNLGEGMIA